MVIIDKCENCLCDNVTPPFTFLFLFFTCIAFSFQINSRRLSQSTSPNRITITLHRFPPFRIYTFVQVDLIYYKHARYNSKRSVKYSFWFCFFFYFCFSLFRQRNIVPAMWSVQWIRSWYGAKLNAEKSARKHPICTMQSYRNI